MIIIKTTTHHLKVYYYFTTYMQIGETALHIAATKGDSRTLTVLLKYNPNLDAFDVVS